jgi:hypothetical protein
MPFQAIPLALTGFLVVALGVVAVVSSTSGGAQWLHRRWQGKAGAAEGDDVPDGRSAGAGGPSDADGLAGAADPSGDAIEGGHGGDGAQEGGLARHPVDDA